MIFVLINFCDVIIRGRGYKQLVIPRGLAAIMLRPSAKEREEDILAQQESFLRSKEAKNVNILDVELKGWTKNEGKSRKPYGMAVNYIRPRHLVPYHRTFAK